MVKLRPQLADLLVCLARRAGEIVLKDEILAEVWPGQYIAESGLSRCVAELRQILQDDAQQPRFIETVTKRGYRLVAPVTWLEKAPQAVSADDQVRSDPDADVHAGVAGAPAAAVKDTGGERRWTFGRHRGVWAAVVLVLVAVGIVAIAMLSRSPASVLTERDPVLLAFENRTGDAVFDETIPLAVSIQLEQSPYLGLLSPGRVQEALRMMKQAPDTPLTRTVGLEICERVGGRALIVTSIARLGSQYVIGLEAVGCGAGRVLARQQVTTERKEQVLDALQRAAAEIRLAVGEPTASIERYNVPIVEATTSSLEALRAVRRGDVAKERGQADLALGLYRDAVALDGDFALAYSRLGIVAAIAGTEAECLSAFECAYALRQHVTLPERLEIEASYHLHVTGEQAKVLEALELLDPLQPFELGMAYGFIPLLERANAHYLLGDWTNARLAFEKILAHSTVDSGRKLLPLAQLGLARTLARAGDVAGSRRTYEQFFERWRHADPDLPVLIQARREDAALPK